MIGLLRGSVVRTGSSDIVLDVNGVGYRILCNAATSAALSASQGDVEVSVHTHVRDDAIILYGFVNDAEREDGLRKHFLEYCPVCTKKDEHIT